MRKVLIATPSYDGTLNVWYVNSLIQTIKMASSIPELDIRPIWMSYDALVQRSRNDLLAIAYKDGFDDIIWIDADIEWNPDWIFQLLKYDLDIVGGTYRKKTDEKELYTFNALSLAKIESNPVEIESIGTGFLRWSRKVIKELYESNEVYMSDGKTAAMAFDIKVEDGVLVGEDINVCNKLKKLGYKIYLDASMTCCHIGDKKYYGDASRLFGG
jgi:glycosyltransferase involved in cell wall biosynthesis